MTIGRKATQPIAADPVVDPRPVDLRTVGIVAGVHGLQGTLRVAPLSDFPERYEALRRVYLVRGDALLGVHEVKRVKWLKDVVLLTLRDVTKREQADELRGAEISVPESETWPLPDNVYYTDDLVGFRAIGDDGTDIGILTGAYEGAQDTLVIDTRKGELLVPFVSEWVGDIDTGRRTIQLLNWRRLTESEEIPPSPDTDDH